MRYRSKIETLRVEVGEVLGRKVQGHYVTLWDLIRKLPRLTNIELYHELDMLYTRDALEANVRWKYPDDLFDALAFVPEDSQVDDYAKDAPTKLTSWTWSSRLAAELCSLERLATIHQTPSFSSIRNLKFLNYQVPSLDMKKIDDEAVLTVDLPEIQKLAAAICALPNLEQLAFKSSTVVNGPLLSLLPRNLKQFELDDCYDITAETLRDFLLTHGHFMQRLTLNHCRALSLGFLPVLRDACPALTALSIELKYFKFIQSRADDNEPDFDVLLEPDQVPTWPSALQYLNIQYMRAWGKFPAQSVTVFFKSLTDSALGLPNLRHIALSAKVTNISRADRYKLRDTWVPRMESVFKRRAKDPKPMPRRRFIIPIQSARREGSPEVLSSTPARRSTRIAERPTTPNTTDEVSEVSQREVAAARRMRKETKMLKISNKGYRADNEESEDELSVAESGFTISTPIFTQRLCDVVDIQIDGQNMTEHQFTEDDFLDPTDDDNDEEYRD